MSENYVLDTIEAEKFIKRLSRPARKNQYAFLPDASNTRLERDQNDDNGAREEWKNVIVIGVPWQANIDRFNRENSKENMQLHIIVFRDNNARRASALWVVRSLQRPIDEHGQVPYPLTRDPFITATSYR